MLTTDTATDEHPQWSPDGRKIAFTSHRNLNADIYVMDSDGSNQTRLTTSAGNEIDPVWSYDGTKIAATSDRDGNVELYVIDADGSNETRIANDPGADWAQSWSPDGTRLVFWRHTATNPYPNQDGVFRVNTDGSGLLWLTDPGSPDSWPTWSTDGRKIAWHASRPGFRGPDNSIWIMNPDGSNKQRVTGEGYESTPSSPDFGRWSPVGSPKLLFGWSGPVSDPGLDDTFTINPDGSGLHRLTRDAQEVYQAAEVWSPDARFIAGQTLRCNDINCAPYAVFVMRSDGTGAMDLLEGTDPDWQPIHTYPRPVAASPVRVPLVPAYQECTAPNRTHGPPLAQPSCAPPVRSSSRLTVGTFGANGKPVKSDSKMTIETLEGDHSTPADEADVHLLATVTDVRMASDLSDYTGSLEARMSLRITDKDNTPHPGGPGAGTVADTSYSFQVPCTATADDTVGSTCAVDTTAEALLLGVAKEGRRAVWQLGQVRLYDDDGNVFMRQGVFVP